MIGSLSEVLRGERLRDHRPMHRLRVARQSADTRGGVPGSVLCAVLGST